MSTHRSRLTAVLLAVAVLAAGCAATVGRSTTAEPKLARSEAAIRKIVVVLTGSAAMQSSADWEALRTEWQTSLQALAKQPQKPALTLARTESGVGAEPAVLVRVTVNDYRYVSQAMRYGVGIFGGNAFMDLDVAFVELPSKRLLGTRRISTSSSAWQGVFSAMTPKQVEAVAADIVNEVTAK